MMRLCAIAMTVLLLAGCGDSAAHASFEQAHAALARGDLATAAKASADAAELGDARYEALRVFVRGNIAFANSMALDAEVNQPNADARARARALAFAEDALAFWRAAVVTRADWPAARRNVERALLRIQALREHRKARKPRRKPPPPKDPPPGAVKINETDLSPAELLALRALLRTKEDAKRSLRRAERKRASVRVERDW